MENFILALSFHNNKVFLTLDHCSLTLENFVLTLENFGPYVNDSSTTNFVQFVFLMKQLTC